MTEALDEDADALGKGSHGVLVHDTSAIPLRQTLSSRFSSLSLPARCLRCLRLEGDVRRQGSQPPASKRDGKRMN